MAYFQTPYTTLIRPMIKNLYGLSLSYSLSCLFGFAAGWPLVLSMLAGLSFYHLCYDSVFKRLGIEIGDISGISAFSTFLLSYIFGLIPIVAFFHDIHPIINAAIKASPILSFTAIASIVPLYISSIYTIFNFTVNTYRYLFTHAYQPINVDAIRRRDDVPALFALAKDAIRYNDFNSFHALVRRLKRLNAQNLILENNGLLRFAAHYDRPRFVEKLLQHTIVKQNASVNHNEPLREALLEHNDEVALMLLNVPAIRENINDNHHELYRLAFECSRWAIRDKIYLITNPPNDFLNNLQNAAQFTQRDRAYYPNNPYLDLKKAFNVEEPFVFRWHHHRVNQRVELRDFAQRGVYADFAPEQLNAIQTMRQRYADILRQRTCNAIFEEIRQAIVAEYERNPARLGEQALPLNYNEALEDQTPYYQHAVHGAYRYLFQRPNPWIAPNADFTVQVGNGLAANTSEQDLNDIATMWLAANDPNAQVPEGFDRDTLKQEFYNAINDLSRAHNANRGADNLGPDRPTCNHGVTQRMYQYYMVFLNEVPEQRPLTSEIVFTKFKQEMINESEQGGNLYRKLRQMDKPTLKNIKNAIDKLCIINLGDFDELNTQEKRLLNRIKFTDAEINNFIDTCKTHFGQTRITDNRPEQIRFQEHRFNTYAEMIQHLGRVAITQFYEDTARNIDNLTREAPQAQDENQAPENGEVLQFKGTRRKAKANAAPKQRIYPLRSRGVRV